ncbi:MAG TPA: hypothetical protein VGI39_34580 [Polyangiaceae bacterium]
MNRRAALLCVILSACSSSSTLTALDDGGGPAPGVTPDATMAGGGSVQNSDDSGAPAPAMDASQPPSSCDASACASLVGAVKRTATQPAHGGKGAVYVAVFEGNPVTDAAGAKVIVRTLLTDQDLSSAGASVAYRIDGIPTASAPYQVIAFLDDAQAVSTTKPQPASGDLISLQLTGGISGIPVTLADGGVTTLDLPLNALMP